MQFFERHDKIIDGRLLMLTLVDIAQQRSCALDKLFKGTALFYPDCLTDDAQISHQQLVQLVKNAYSLFKQKDISFQIGRRLFPGTLGHLGNALMHCRDMATMLRICRLHQQKIFPFLYLSIRYDREYCYLHFNPAVSIEHHSFQVFIIELVTSAIVSALKMRLGQWPTLDIQFPFAEPRHIEQYQVNFPCEYRFITTMGHQPLQLKIAKHLLHAPFPEHSVYLARFYRQQLAISSSHSSNIQQVGLVQCILQHFKKHKQLTLEQLASLLCMSRATLKRKLTLHHTSYQQLWDLHRQQVAVFELAEQQKCNEDVAQTLQFSDITNFRRSVKRWTGMTPDDIRRKFAEKLNIEDQHAL